MSQAREYKDTIYEQLARIGKAVSSPRRLELLDLLCQAPRTVDVLAKLSNQSVANTSQHLQILRNARLVEAVKDGLFVTYRLADDGVSDFFRSLRNMAEQRLADVEKVTREFLEQRGLMEPVEIEGLIERVQEGDVTIVDVRPPEEFIAGHIPGAVSIPLPELKASLSQLPHNREIVAYCRGPYCVLAIQAIELLRAEGFNAVRLGDSVHDWRARGLPVAVEGSEK